MSVGFTATVASRRHPHQTRVEFILHVAFQNAVLNQHVVLAWRTFVINRHRTSAIDHRAVINHGTQF